MLSLVIIGNITGSFVLIELIIVVSQLFSFIGEGVLNILHSPLGHGITTGRIAVFDFISLAMTDGMSFNLLNLTGPECPDTGQVNRTLLSNRKNS